MTDRLTELEGELEEDAWGEDSLTELSSTLSKGQNDVCDAVEEPDLGEARGKLEGVVEQLEGLKSAYEKRVEGLQAQRRERSVEGIEEEHLGERFDELIKDLEGKINQVNGDIDLVQEEINFIDKSEQASLEFNNERRRLSVGYDGCQERLQMCGDIKTEYESTLSSIQERCGSLKREVGRIGTLEAMGKAENDVEELVSQQGNLASIRSGFDTEQEGLNGDVTGFKEQSGRYVVDRDRYLEHVGKLRRGEVL